MFKRIKNILLFILFITALIIFLSCSNITTAADGVILTDETVAAVATTDISEIEAKPIESEVVVGDIIWKILNVSDEGTGIVSSNFTFNAVIGKFILLEFMVRNNSSDSRIIYDLNVIDSAGRVFSLCLPAYAYLEAPEQVCVLVDIHPDIEYTFNAPFDISPDSEGLVLEVTDLIYPPNNKAYIDLGV